MRFWIVPGRWVVSFCCVLGGGRCEGTQKSGSVTTEISENPKIAKGNCNERGSTKKKRSKNVKKHTTVGIRWSSPTQLLIHRSQAYVWQSGRDAQFS